MRIRALAFVVFASWVFAGCGSDVKTIDTPTLVRVLNDAGFRNFETINNKKAAEKLAQELHRPELARNPVDEDTILTRGYTNPILMPLTAVRLPSTAAADRRFHNDQPLLKGDPLSPSERQAMPSDYKRNRLSEAQVCNVVLTSYNPTLDATLTKRFNDAASALRAYC